MTNLTRKPVVRSGLIKFYVPTNIIDDTNDDNEDVTIVYTEKQLPVTVLGVNLLMDFIFDGKSKNGSDVIVITKNKRIEPFITMLN